MRRGFTLIELSIVLVIIALIVAGVMTGRDLIHSSRVRATVSQFQEYDAAVNTFRMKYNCIPGDCPTAEQMNLGVAGDWGANGDGSGGIIYETENTNFWYHLDQAGLLKSPRKLTFDSPKPATITASVNTPPTVAEFRTSANSTRGGRAGWIVLGGTDLLDDSFAGAPHHFVIAAGTFQSAVNASATVMPLDAYNMDQKIDDSLPLSGKVNAWGHIRPYFVMAASAGAGSASANYCVANDVTPNQYNILNQTGTNGLCTLSFRSSF